MCGRQWHQLENSYQKLLCWCLCYSHPAIVRRRTKGLNNIEHLKIAIHQLSSPFYESIPVSGCRNDPLHSGFVVGCFYEWLPGTRIRLPMLLTALRLLCCGLVVHAAPSVKPFQFLSSVSDFVLVSCRNAACFQVCSCGFCFSMSFQARLLSSEVTTKQHIFANLKDL